MKIYEIFQSIDGECNAFFQGCLTTFIRFSGCNINCLYCDTKYALKLSDGKEMSVDEIVNKVTELGCKKITITGGEPLFQRRDFNELTKRLWHSGFHISVETNGTLPLTGYGIGSWVVDFKLPSSEYYHKIDYSIFVGLNSSDFVKFVILDRNDYETALRVKKGLQEQGCHAKFAFSPVFGSDIQKVLVDCLIDDKVFDVIVNVQIHKFLGIS